MHLGASYLQPHVSILLVLKGLENKLIFSGIDFEYECCIHMNTLILVAVTNK